MTFDNIITLVLNRCGNRSGDQDLRAAALSELGLIQTRLEEAPELPWFLISEKTSTDIIPGDPRLPLPSDFLLEDEEAHTWVQNTAGTWSIVTKIEYDRIQATYQNEAQGLPKNYALRGEYLYFGPIPDQSYKVRMTYWKKDAVPALGTENEWALNAPDVLIAELGYVISGQYLSDFQKRKTFEADIARAQSRMLAKEIAREETNMFGQMY